MTLDRHVASWRPHYTILIPLEPSYRSPLVLCKKNEDKGRFKRACHGFP